MPTIDRLTNVGYINASFGVSSANARTAYVAQTFKATGSALTSIEFLIDGQQESGTNGTAVAYRVLITTVEGTGDDVKPKTVLFESGILSEPIDANHSYHHVTRQHRVAGADRGADLRDRAGRHAVDPASTKSQLGGQLSRCELQGSGRQRLCRRTCVLPRH